MTQWPLSYLSYPPPVICSPGWGVPAHNVMLHAEAILEPFPALVHPLHRWDTAHLRWGQVRERDIAIPCFVVCSFWTYPDISPFFFFVCFFACCWALCGCFLSAPQDKTFILPQLSKSNTKVCFLLAVWHPLLTLCLVCHFIIQSLTSEVFALLMLLSTTTTAKKLHLLTHQSLFQHIYEYVGRLVTSPLW